MSFFMFHILILGFVLTGCQSGRYKYDKLPDGKGQRIKVQNFRCQQPTKKECVQQFKREMHTQGEDMCGILDHSVSNCILKSGQAACDVRCITSSERSGKKAKNKELDAEGFDEFEEGF